MSLQIYGIFDYGSIAVVSRALTKALDRANLDFTIYAHGSMTPRYIDVRGEVAMNSQADVGIFVGGPRDALGWLAGHDVRILMTVCEASPVPHEWVEIANQMSLVVVPSQFCQLAFQHSGVKAPIMVVPHGCDFEPGPPTIRSRPRVRLVHFSEAGSFPARKGTSQLIQAYRRTYKDFPETELHIKSSSLRLEKVLKPNDSIWPNKGNVTALQSYYRSFDAVVQPSRGEGFGLVGLEARCLGVPVMLTATSGHMAHLMPSVDVVVPVGPTSHIETQGNEVGSCPTVTVDAVEEGLRRLLGDLAGHKRRTMAWARMYGRAWRWNRVLYPLVRKIAELGGKSSIYALDEEHGERGW